MLKDLYPYSREKVQHIFRKGFSPRTHFWVKIFTEKFAYSILGYLPHTDKEGRKHLSVLSSNMGCRVSEVGEDWHRGRDFPDGRLNEKTWKKIKDRILSNELQEVVKERREVYHEGPGGRYLTKEEAGSERKR